MSYRQEIVGDTFYWRALYVCIVWPTATKFGFVTNTHREVCFRGSATPRHCIMHKCRAICQR